MFAIGSLSFDVRTVTGLLPDLQLCASISNILATVSHASRDAYVHKCMCVCECVCVCAYVYVCIYISIYILM